MTNFNLDGVDYSANAPAIPGALSLLSTVPQSLGRRGYFIENQDAADNVYVVYDDAAGSLTPTVLVLAHAATAGTQGGSITMTGLPHTGRIRIYGDHSTTKMTARVW